MKNLNLYVLKINRSYKFPGYCFVTTQTQGSKSTFDRKRRMYATSEPGKFWTVVENAVLGFELNKDENVIEAKNIVFVRKNKKNVDSAFNVVISESPVGESKSMKAVVNSQKEVFHEKYNEIKCCIENNVPVYLAGPAGSGKNFTLEQIAKNMGMDFYFTNSVQQEYKLTGFIDAGGVYHETEFYKACTSEKPCVFFLDELDASVPEVLVLLNAAIANGYFEFPNGKVVFGDKVHFVSAGNTVGSGADEQYSGRMVIDQATLDRFAIIDFEYCLRIEMKLSNGNTDLVSFIRQLRKYAEENSIRSTFSYRCISMVTKLEKCMKLDEVLKIAVLKGLDKDTINSFSISGDTKYHQALKKLQK